ncbi:MAG: zinc finger domain-containing protein [Nanopusillaceae archaeon]
MKLENIVKTNSSKKLIISDITVKFKCPNCGQGIIVRSNKERLLCLEWICTVCGYKGP